MSVILDAADKIFAAKGLEDTTVADIADAAGCAVGSVYHHFRDKSALVAALFEIRKQEFLTTLEDAVDPVRWEGATVGEILQGYLQFSVETTRREQPMSFVYLDQSLRSEAHELHHILFERLRELLRERVDQIGHPRPLDAIDFVLDQLRATIFLHRKQGSIMSFLSLPNDAVVEEALTMACQYLDTEKPE